MAQTRKPTDTRTLNLRDLPASLVRKLEAAAARRAAERGEISVQSANQFAKQILADFTAGKLHYQETLTEIPASS